MAWRSYIDPSDGQLWWTDDSGNFIPDAEFDRSNLNPPPSPSPNPSPSGFPVVGGNNQFQNYNWETQLRHQQQLLTEQQRQFDLKLAQDRDQFQQQLELQKQAGLLSEKQLQEQMRQFDARQAQEQKQFEASQAQDMAKFTASQGQQNQQFWANLMSSLSGPRDWYKYQIAQSQMPESVRGGNMDLMQIANTTPGFGAMTGDPGNSWESVWANMQRGQNWTGQKGDMPPTYTGSQPPTSGDQAGQQGYFNNQQDQQYQAYQRDRSTQPKGDMPPGQVGGSATNVIEAPNWVRPNPAQDTGVIQDEGGSYRRPPANENVPPRSNFTQPIQISPGQYQRMSPTLRAMMEGQWSSQGIDPGDAWSKMRAAWNYGNANTRTRWGA